MINIPTTDIMTLITGEANTPAKTGRDGAADTSFLSVIDSKETGADLQVDGLVLLPETAMVNSAVMQNPVAIKAVLSSTLTGPKPESPRQGEQLSDQINTDISATSTPNTGADPALRTDGKSILQGNDSTTHFVNSAPLVAKGEGGSPPLKAAQNGPLQTPFSMIDTPALAQTAAWPSQIKTSNVGQDEVVSITSLPLIPAGISGTHGRLDETSKLDAPTSNKPITVPVPLNETQPQSALIELARGGGMQPSANAAAYAGDKAHLNTPMFVPPQSSDPRAPSMPTTDQTVDQIKPNVPSRVSSTLGALAAPQSSPTTTGSYPRTMAQNTQGMFTNLDVPIENQAPAMRPTNQPQNSATTPLPTNTPTQIAPDISTNTAKPPQPQASGADASIEVNQPQTQRTDAVLLQQSQPLSTPIQSAALSPNPPLRDASDGRTTQHNPEPRGATEAQLRHQATMTQTSRLPEAVPIVSAAELNVSEAVEPLSTPELIPLETRSVDSMALIRQDTSVTRPEVMRHVAQQLADAARQMPDRPVELALNPEELGRVRLTFTSTDTGIHIAVMAERGETMDLLRRHIDTLAQEFREMGYKDVNFEFSRDGQSEAGNDESNAQNNAEHEGRGVDAEALAPVQLSLEPSNGLDLRL